MEIRESANPLFMVKDNGVWFHHMSLQHLIKYLFKSSQWLQVIEKEHSFYTCDENAHKFHFS